MATVRRTIGKSTRNGEVYWFAREKRNVVARAETERKLNNQLKKRDAWLEEQGHNPVVEEEEEVDSSVEDDIELVEDNK